MGIIYKLTAPNGKAYIGQSIKNNYDRVNQHKYRCHYNINNGCSKLYEAINQFGFESFHIEIVASVANKDLDDTEQLMIQRYNTVYPNGFNLTSGGKSTKYCDESRQKMSTKHKDLYKENDSIRKHIQLNGFNHKINKDLPMYLCETRNNIGELIGYRVYMHPANPRSKKFCCKADLNSAFNRAKAYLDTLDKMQGKN